MAIMPEDYMEQFSDLELVNELVRRGVRFEVYPNLTIYGPTRVEYRDAPPEGVRYAGRFDPRAND